MWKKDETPKAPPAEVAPRKQPEPVAPSRSTGRAVIGASLVVEGSVRGEEDLLVEGSVVGDIMLPKNTVTVGRSGNLQATIHARIVIVEGRVEGDLVGGEQIEIRRSGNVLGNITSPRVGLEDGAQFKGNIDMSPKGRPAPGSDPAKGGGKQQQGHGKGGDESVPEAAPDAKLPG